MLHWDYERYEIHHHSPGQSRLCGGVSPHRRAGRLPRPSLPKESQHGYSIDKLVEQGVEFFVVYLDSEPAGCGGVQIICDPQDPVGTYGELKRMYVRDEYRGLGLAKRLLEHLEALALGRGASVMRLETGIHQPEAVGLYGRCGYHRITPSEATLPTTR